MSLCPDAGYYRRTPAMRKKIKRNNALLDCLKEYGLDEALKRGFNVEAANKQWNRYVKARKDGWKGYCPSLPLPTEAQPSKG